MTETVNCPYCGTGRKSEIDDAYAQDGESRYEAVDGCSNCGRAFVIRTVYAIKRTGLKIEEPPTG